MNNQTKVSKPLSITMKEAETGIINEINKYNLHPSLLELILRNVYTEVATLAKNAYEVERTNYINSVNETEKSSNDESEK